MKKLFSLFALLSMLLGAKVADGQYTFSTVAERTDVGACGYVSYTVTTTGYSAGLSVKAIYGDGFSDTQAVGSSWHEAQSVHSYSISGTYTVKLILFSGATHMDSSVFSANVVTCNYFYIGGYLDANSNCVWDHSESAIRTPATAEVDSAGVPVDTISWIYSFVYPGYGPPGTIYTFRLLSPPANMSLSCPLSGLIYDTVTTGITTSQKNFAFQCTSSTDFDLGINVTSRAGTHSSPSFRANIYAFNNYCTTEAATVQMTFSPKYTYSTSASPVPTSVSGTTITWNFPSVTNTTPEFITVYLYPNVVLTDGDTVHSSYSITPLSGDVNTANNSISEIDTCSHSYDPNYKSVSPKGNILPGTKLQYTIHFENTGHDTAFNIYVMDTLSPDVDPKSLSVLSSSATVNTMLLRSGGYNIIKFDFPGINLLDSSHIVLCDGMVVYSINTKTGLSYGTAIDNKAGIYFDDNPVVMTNTVESVIGTPEGVATVSKLSKTRVYPNPATDELSIFTEGTYSEAAISNLLGQVLMSQPMSSGVIKVNVRSLPDGIYYVTLRGADGVEQTKFVKR